MVKIKICGITRLEDAVLCVNLGAWAIGFIFFKNSKRYIEPDKAGSIIKNLPKNIEKTGVFVNSSLKELKEIVEKTNITLIQLHGEETEEFCLKVKNELNIPVIKAFRVKSPEDLVNIEKYKGLVSAILLDTYVENIYGGTGRSFDLDIAVKAMGYNIPLIIAGGINKENIVGIYEKVQPYAFDISSGVEVVEGIKDHNNLKELFLRLRIKDSGEKF